MLFLSVKAPCSFMANSKVLVYKLHGVFNDIFLTVRENHNFTLPKGQYIVDGTIKPVKFSHLDGKKLDTPEKHVKLKRHNVNMVNNNSKVSIDVFSGNIFIDRSFWNSLGEIQKKFVSGHELGHYKYFDEKKADKYAAFLLLSQGYNPTQIVAAINTTLSDLSQERKENLYNFLKK